MYIGVITKSHDTDLYHCTRPENKMIQQQNKLLGQSASLSSLSTNPAIKGVSSPSLLQRWATNQISILTGSHLDTVQFFYHQQPRRLIAVLWDGVLHHTTVGASQPVPLSGSCQKHRQAVQELVWQQTTPTRAYKQLSTVLDQGRCEQRWHLEVQKQAEYLYYSGSYGRHCNWCQRSEMEQVWISVQTALKTKCKAWSIHSNVTIWKQCYMFITTHLNTDFVISTI